MLCYLTLVQCVTYMDQDGDLMIKLNSFIFSKEGRGGGKSTQTNYLCSGMIELQFNTIINYLTHSCEAADVINSSEMPPLCCHNPELFSAAKTSTYSKEHHSWQNAFRPSSADSDRRRCVSWFMCHWYTNPGANAIKTNQILNRPNL